jgi:outer membrane immunogenic protein
MLGALQMRKNIKISILSLLITSSLAPSVSNAEQFDWSGFYAGGTLGSSRSNSDWKGRGEYADYLADGFGNGIGNFSKELRDTSTLLGVYAGYNIQSGNLLYGFEVDYSRANSSKNAQLDGGEGYVRLDSELKALGSARVRLGYAADKLLVYGTAGIALNDTDHKWIDRNDFYSVTSKGSTSKDVGWVAGAGIEYALTDKMILRGEGLYYDFSSTSDRDPAGAKFSVEQDVKVLRAGLAYKF